MVVTDHEFRAISHGLTSFPHVLITDNERRLLTIFMNRNSSELDKTQKTSLANLAAQDEIDDTDRTVLRELLKAIRQSLV